MQLMADAASPARILETRKTAPGLRLVDKWAVRSKHVLPISNPNIGTHLLLFLSHLWNIKILRLLFLDTP